MSTGFLGLNTVPSARFDPVGTIRGSVSFDDIYAHASVGAQILSPVFVNVRQSARTDNIFKDAEQLYPGIDLKIQLLEESRFMPSVALGLQSAAGHAMQAGEFLAFSKRYHAWDFTVGLGWGRYGTAHHLDNPLKHINDHFGGKRTLNTESPNTIEDWFTGDSVGVFGGVEYRLPYDGLSLKLDYGADRYTVEKQLFESSTPSPWAAGLSYTYKDILSAAIGTRGGEDVIGRLSFRSSPAHWPLSSYSFPEAAPFYKQEPTVSNFTRARLEAEKDGIILFNITSQDGILESSLMLPPDAIAPAYLGRAARHLARHSEANITTFSITPHHNGIAGAPISFTREAVEKLVDDTRNNQNEIWHNTRIPIQHAVDKDTHTSAGALWTDQAKFMSLRLQNTFSPAEEDHGILYRSALLLDTQATGFLGLVTGTTLRLNIDDNLEKLAEFRPPSLAPTRSDIADFADKRLAIERSYISFARGVTDTLNIAATAGYLDETHAGIGGEVLYRPPAARFAVGAELWRAHRRDPFSTLNLGLDPFAVSVTTGHANIWYDLPHDNVTLSFSAGRYLAGDAGISFGAVKTFDNGAELGGSLTVSNASDPDVFGGTTHNYHTLYLKLPLGSVPIIPNGSMIETRIQPLGRDAGQRLDNPLPLYATTTQHSVKHMAQYWHHIKN